VNIKRTFVAVGASLALLATVIVGGSAAASPSSRHVAAPAMKHSLRSAAAVAPGTVVIGNDGCEYTAEYGLWVPDDTCFATDDGNWADGLIYVYHRTDQPTNYFIVIGAGHYNDFGRYFSVWPRALGDWLYCVPSNCANTIHLLISGYVWNGTWENLSQDAADEQTQQVDAQQQQQQQQNWVTVSGPPFIIHDNPNVSEQTAANAAAAATAGANETSAALALPFADENCEFSNYTVALC
jgi:hypothetical protein